ncbi:MAG TPA: hypothetical protein VGP72_30260 [Planctomycetota bacterium]|jgi:hypothetical protein
MSDPQSSAWRRFLFYRLFEWDRRMIRFVLGLPKRWPKQAAVDPEFDQGWVRRLNTVLAALVVLGMVAGTLPFAPAWMQARFDIIALFCGVELCVYFGRLLFQRMQCSLLEWCVIIAFLGNIEGMLLTTAGFHALGILGWAMALLVLGWVLYGTVKGLAQAAVLQIEEPGRRVWLLAANWYTLAAPAMLLAGLGLHYGRKARMGLVGPKLESWAVPLLVAGALGLALRIVLGLKAARAAREILAAPDNM